MGSPRNERHRQGAAGVNFLREESMRLLNSTVHLVIHQVTSFSARPGRKSALRGADFPHAAAVWRSIPRERTIRRHA